MDQQFKFKIGQRVVDAYSGKRVYVRARTIEAALGKTYRIQYQNGKWGGYVPEDQLHLEMWP